MRRAIFLFLTVLLVVAGSGMGSATAQGVNWDASQLCKNDGWETLRDANGNPFKNQGQCVQYAVQGGEFSTLVATIDCSRKMTIIGSGLLPGDEATVTATHLDGSGTVSHSLHAFVDCDGNLNFTTEVSRHFGDYIFSTKTASGAPISCGPYQIPLC
jgi:hypothetical protein